MKKLIVGKDVNYAATGGGAANGATTPDLLDAGSVGIYAIDPATSKSVLVTTANDSTLLAAGLDEYVIAVGTQEGGPVVSQPISIAATGTGFPKSAAAAADTPHAVAVGYNGTSGSLNLPTLVDRDYAGVTLSNVTNGLNQKVDKDSFEASNLRATDGDYEVAFGIVESWNARSADVKFTTSANLLSNATGAAFANVATATVTSGSSTVTTSAAHGVGVGDYVVLGGGTYQAVTGTTGSTLVLDRPYVGVSETIANGSTVDAGATAPTEAGVSFTSTEPGLVFAVAVQGVAEDADITVLTSGAIGHGSEAFMKENVRVHGAYMGYYD